MVTEVQEKPIESPVESPQEVLFCGYKFHRDMFTSDVAWYKFTNGKNLTESDFVDKDNYSRYFFLGLEIVDFANVIITGQKGGGKSLWMTWLAYELNRLFNKPATLNYHPKEGFGDYHYLTEQSFLDEWVKLTGEADRTDVNIKSTELERLTKFSVFYNHVIGIDEARKWATKYRSNGRILGYIGELVDTSRHNHNIILFAMPNAFNMLNRDTVLENRTHEVHCSFNTHYWGCATYAIKHINSGKTKWMHLSAKKFSHLWQSWNIIGMSRPITKKQMEDAQKRARGELDGLSKYEHKERNQNGIN
jgi:hypothetical protein